MNDHVQWAAASLRIASETVTIDEISGALDLSPTDFSIKGSPYSPRNPQSKLMTHNLWVRESGLDSVEDLSAHIEAVLTPFEARRQQLERLAGECIIDLFVGYSPANGPGETTLSHLLLARLAALPVSITFDLMPPILQDRPGGAVQAKWSEGILAVIGISVSTNAVTATLGLNAVWPDVIQPGNQLQGLSSLISSEPVVWARDSGQPQSARLEDHIVALLDLAEPYTDGFQRLSKDASTEVRLCYAGEWGQGGFSLDHATLQRLAALPFNFTIELTYPPSASESTTPPANGDALRTD